MKLHARADAIRSSFNNIRSQQQASGYDMRSDMVAAASRMDEYLGAADRAMQTNKLDFAQKSMEKAEQDISKLEKFLGR